jgi:hypothetical protein
MKTNLTAVLLVGLFAAPVMAQVNGGTKDRESHRVPAWIVAFSGIVEMQQEKGGPEVVKKLLEDRHTIVVAANPQPNTMDDARRAVSVMSLEKCKAAIDKPSNAGLKTLLVDLEHWPGTPQEDQENPEKATRRCHEFAHQNGRNITVIAVPAMDLMAVLDPKFKGTQYQAAIHYGLEGKLATASDGVEVQLENIEDNPEQFERTLRTIVDQIKAARRKSNLNPEIPIYAGLSTGVVGKHFSANALASMLKEDVIRTRDFVTGYWMAIPPKDLCPGCGDPKPEVAVKLLQSVNE